MKHAYTVCVNIQLDHFAAWVKILGTYRRHGGEVRGGTGISISAAFPRSFRIETVHRETVTFSAITLLDTGGQKVNIQEKHNSICMLLMISLCLQNMLEVPSA